MAAQMLTMRSRGLLNYIRATKHKAVGQEVILKQLMDERVLRQDYVNQETCGNVTWGDLESTGLVVLVPDKTDSYDPNSLYSRPLMPFLLYAVWNDLLQQEGLLLNTGIKLLQDHSLTLSPETKECLDLACPLSKLYFHAAWRQATSVPLKHIIPLAKGGTVATRYDGCMLKVPVPTGSHHPFLIKRLHKWTRDGQLQQMLLAAQSASSLQHLAYCGPGNEKKVDWWLVLEVDQQSSTAAWQQIKWLVIQGQSKKRDALGGSVAWEVVKEEQGKCHACASNNIASLFVFVTDQRACTVPRDGGDVVVIGMDQHVAYYGIAA